MTSHNTTAPTSRVLRTHAAGIVVVVAAMAGMYATVIGPRFAAAQHLATNRAFLAQAQDDAARAGVAAKTAEDAALSLAAQLAKDTFTLRPASALNSVITDITTAAESGLLTISEITPAAEVPGPTYVKYPIRIKGNTTYPAVTRLIGILHTRFPDLALVGFSLRADAAHAKSPAAVVLDFEWYAVRNDTIASPSK
ncbi:hypothetical protein D4Q85_00015 [bacterium]|nr:MAG: hypothetical protein D4Q85_00015 [bacterium]